MSRATFLTISVLVAALGIAAYNFYYHTVFKRPALTPLPQSQEPPEHSTLSQRPESRSLVPPVPPGGLPVFERAPEPVRTLAGITSEQLEQIEHYLPEGAHVATYPVGNTHLRAAIMTADLDDDGSAETIVIHTEQSATQENPTPQLYLTVLSHEGKSMKVRSSARLTDGGVFFNIEIDGVHTPLAAQDVTGDKRPEILVASGVGASLGGALQVYSFHSSVLANIGKIDGHSFYLRREGTSQPSEILARWKDDPSVTAYRWDGHRFEQGSKIPLLRN